MYPCTHFPTFCLIRLIIGYNDLPTKRLEHAQQYINGSHDQ